MKMNSTVSASTAPGYPFMRSGIYEASPLNTCLGLFVIVQNSVVCQHYFPERAKLAGSMFLSIAVADMLMAQGLLVLTGFSFLVYALDMDISYMFYGLCYYQATGAIGHSCSRLYNVILTVALTTNIKDPFYRINTAKVRVAAVAITMVLVALHLSDVIGVAYVAAHPDYVQRIKERYISLILVSQVPGLGSVLGFVCFGSGVESDLCEHQGSYLGEVVPLAVYFGVYLGGPAVVILVCMIIQLVYLPRTLGDCSNPLLATARHVSITVFLISVLYFVCNIAYLAAIIGFTIAYRKPSWVVAHPSFEVDGLGCCLAELTLPLLNAALFPLVLISRKPELRSKYMEYMRRAVLAPVGCMRRAVLAPVGCMRRAVLVPARRCGSWLGRSARDAEENLIE